MDEVYGLKPEVLEPLKQQLTLNTPTQIQKIPIENASLEELMALPYLITTEAKKIISLRTKQETINLVELARIEGFGALKIKRLTLYLF